MMPHPELLLPDDEHYYFGVELPWSPEAVQGRLLRKPEFLYSATSDDDEIDEEYRTSWYRKCRTSKKRCGSWKTSFC